MSTSDPITHHPAGSADARHERTLRQPSEEAADAMRPSRAVVSRTPVGMAVAAGEGVNRPRRTANPMECVAVGEGTAVGDNGDAGRAHARITAAAPDVSPIMTAETAWKHRTDAFYHAATRSPGGFGPSGEDKAIREDGRPVPLISDGERNAPGRVAALVAARSTPLRHPVPCTGGDS